MMAADSLIEEAFKAHEGAPTWQDDPAGRDAAIRWHMRGFNDALAVLEAHAPTDDEREVLAEIVKRVTHVFGGPSMAEFVNDPPLRKHYATADAILAAGFRRAEAPEQEFGVRLTEGPERYQGSDYIYRHNTLAIAEDQAALNPEYEAEYFTRRKAGPWVPVNQEQETE